MLFVVVGGVLALASQLANASEPATSAYNRFLPSFERLWWPALLLAQIATILLAARLLAWVCRKVGQPAVVGEIAAGIALGPSLLGRYFPAYSAALFPVNSLAGIKLLGHLGLVLFMFGVGLELELSRLRQRVPGAWAISLASVMLPFGLGLGLASLLYASYAPVGVLFLPFGLFMGIAMSVTAFPVLARIVHERGLQKTPLGMLVIVCAATDDLLAWCLLATVVTLAKSGSPGSALLTAVLALAYLTVMLKMVRPLLARVMSGGTNWRPVAAGFATLLLSALVAEAIEIHALFGAFLAGAIMPPQAPLGKIIRSWLPRLAAGLLPLFFAFSGLRTEIGLLNTPALWWVCGVVIGVAVLGKSLGATLTARLIGYRWPDSLRIGALMNTRGLMELVVLNVGYDLGILSAPIFAILVLMALTTTCMTGPALNLIDRYAALHKITRGGSLSGR